MADPAERPPAGPPFAPARGVAVVGYGSLMSARGLAAHAGGLLDAYPVRLEAARRFAKPSQRGGCLAMDLVAERAAIAAERLEPGAPPGGCEGLLLLVTEEASAAIARREGYPPACWRRLLAAAGDRQPGLLLLEVARDAGDDPLAYRRALRELAGPTPLDCYHYLPHPVRLGGGGAAVVYVAPEPGCTGDPQRDSAKRALAAPGGSLLHELGRRGAAAFGAGFEPAAQARYVELCLLAAAHGLHLGDLLGGPLAADDPTAALIARWRADPAPLAAERAALRALIPGLAGAYGRRFPPELGLAWRRAGLEGPQAS